MRTMIGRSIPAQLAMRCVQAMVALSAGSVVQAQFVENTLVLHTLSVPSGGTFGWAVADLPDINGDGARDIAVGAVGPGRVYLYSGQTGALLRTLSASPAEPGGGQFGYSLGSAGDVNGDGVADVVVGAVLAASNFGAAYIYSGSNGALLRRITGEVAGDRFGASVAGAGDVDGDTFADILVGAEGNDTQGADSGRAYVYSGATGSLLRTYEAESSGDFFGGGIANAGDIDQDGFDEHIVGAHNAGPSAGGRAYVYSGQTGAQLLPTLIPPLSASQYGNFFVAGAGDVNADGVLDLYVGDYNDNGGRGRAFAYSGANGALLHSLPGATPGDGQGPGRGAGDVNGDGYGDLIVGRYTNSTGASQAGRAVVYSGMNGAVLQTMTSTRAGENFGFDAVGLGDVNFDQRLDFLIAAATGDRVYVISSDTTLPTVPTMSTWGLVSVTLLLLTAGTVLLRILPERT